MDVLGVLKLYSSECDSKLGVIPINPLNNCTPNISDHRWSSTEVILQNVNQIAHDSSEQEKPLVSSHELSNSGKMNDLKFFK